MPNPINYISKCGKFIHLFKFGGTFIISSMRCRTSPVFLGAVVSRPVTLLKNLHQRKKKCKNGMPKSRQNLSSLLSIVDYIFFNLFLVVHLRKKYYFGKEKQYSTQNSVFLERFYRKSGSPDSLYGKCRNDFDRRLREPKNGSRNRGSFEKPRVRDSGF